MIRTPINKVPRYKTIHCRLPKCGRRIASFDRGKYPHGHVPVGDIFSAIRRHRKKYHPKAFKQMIERAQRAKSRAKRGMKKAKFARREKKKWHGK